MNSLWQQLAKITINNNGHFISTAPALLIKTFNSPRRDQSNTKHSTALGVIKAIQNNDNILQQEGGGGGGGGGEKQNNCF